VNYFANLARDAREMGGNVFAALRDPQFYRDAAENARQLGGGVLAGTVGAPVDLATMAMRPMGYDVPDERVVGSSNYFAKLLRVDPESVPYKVGSLLPTDAGDAMKYGGLLAGHIAFHGSPHRFERFDTSKIGTGEGAQAYGRGLYFAEAPEVAETYRRGLSTPEVVVGGERYAPSRTVADRRDPRAMAHTYLDTAHGAQSGEPFSYARKSIRSLEGDSPMARDAVEQLNQWELAGARFEPGGALYKVDIADESIPRMLDWDAPLSQQPAVKDAFKAAREKAGMSNEYWTPGKLASGAMEYGKLESVVGKARASELLREAGIPGIRYKDGVSRGTEAGTHNFVVFDDSLVKILETK
jgi:hypothetical protein